jgi:hypothetical protein
MQKPRFLFAIKQKAEKSKKPTEKETPTSFA